ncbi:MAG: hypothetical protein BGN88_12780, partial [Clostridiales bacterium 43-6]
GLFVLIFLIFAGRLISMQLIHSAEYKKDADVLSAKTTVIKAARGEILDRYGRPLAVNREGYHIVFDAAYLKMDRANDTIGKLVNLLKTEKEIWRDNLPMTSVKPYSFLPDKTNEVALLKKKLNLNTYATVQNCYDAMVEKYKLENYSEEMKRILMGVRYSMDDLDFSVTFPYTFAEDISQATRSKIMEASSDISGVRVDVVPIREYTAPDVAPHILGTVGPIYAEDFKTLKDKGYSYNDYLGRSGVEKAFESYLRGKDGEKKTVLNSAGKIVSETVQEPVAGNTVMLTIDKNLQQVAQNSLNKMIKTLNSDNIPATAGSVVVINVNNGEILASANYPTYDMNTYKKDYAKLSTDTTRPLFDRAFNGTYPPGSTFKPAMASIGLQTGVITKDSVVNCTRYYRYYEPTIFKCLGYHHNLNVVTALSKSCNFFFYDTARKTGIENMNRYCKLYGLGVTTGVEVPEAKGLLAGPEYRKTINSVWHPGDTLQAAIGQSDNAFTPLQLASYTATVANGGTRYQAHLLKEVKSYGLNENVVDPTAKVLNTTGISAAVYDTVKKGMLSVTSDGTASAVFRNYPIKVGGKTGTAQVPKGEDNGVFIAFAPYDKPEIAVALVVEHGYHGSSSA